MNRFCAERLQSLVRTLELNRLDEYSSLQKVANFATLVSTYERGMSISTIQRFLLEMTVWPLGFLLILEPFETDNATVPNPVFHFVYVLDSAPMLAACS
jgi:DNA excision repair protein ERCC-2